MTNAVRGKTVILIIVLGSIFALPACTSSDAQDPTRNGSLSEPPSSPGTQGPESSEPSAFVNFDMFVQEYDEAAEDLAGSLPNGVSFPKKVRGDWDRKGQFEEGAGAMQAAFYLQCAWLHEFVSAEESQDKDEAKNALDQLQGWVDLPQVAARTDQESKSAWFEHVITPAREGDSHGVLELARGCKL